MRNRRFLTAGTLIVACASLMTSLIAPSSAATPPAPDRLSGNPNPFCSWWLMTTPSSMNVAFPDSNAAYWTTPYLAKPGESIRVNGTFPEARYMSLTTYNNTFGTYTNNGLISQVADYQILPDAGSLNPWAADATSSTPTGGNFTVTLQSDVSADMTNTLPILPATPSTTAQLPENLGFLIYRVYLPAGMDFSSVPLPQLTVVSASGEESALPRCSTKDRRWLKKLKIGVKLAAAVSGLIKDGIGRPPAPCGDDCTYNAFLRPTSAQTSRVFPNPSNAYAAMVYTPQAGKILVVKMLAPTTPQGEQPVAWPTTDYQLRYWSMCNNVYVKPYPVVANPTPGGGVTYGCISDDTAVVDEAGYATFVFSRPSDRPKNATAANDINWLPMSATQPRSPGLVALRHMLPSADFTESVLAVPGGSNPAATAAIMGDYYPTTVVCSVRTFERSGAAGC